MRMREKKKKTARRRRQARERFHSVIGYDDVQYIVVCLDFNAP